MNTIKTEETFIHKVLEEKGNFQCHSKWERRLKSTIIDTDMETMVVDLHYGFYSLRITVLNTLI